MAEINTGLGWAAKDTWLMNAPGTVATIPAGLNWTLSGYETQQIPVTAPTTSDLINNGLLLWDYVANRARSRLFYGANKPGAIMAAFYEPDSLLDRHVIIFVPDDSYEIYEQNWSGDTPSPNVYYFTEPSTTYVGTDLVYYYHWQTTGGSYPDPFECFVPVFNEPYSSTVEQLIAVAYPYITQGSPVDFEKVNAGYAVACVAKWKTGAGVVIKTPVLISSNSDFVDMTVTPDIGLSIAKLNILRNGMRFYMAFFNNTARDFTTTNPVFEMTAETDPYLSLEQVFAFIADLEHSAILVLDAPDPYGGNSEEDGGEQTDPEDEPVEEETLPIPAVVGLGFSTIYVPTQSDLAALAGYMWGGHLDLDNFLKLFANPMDSILGLSAVPLVLSGTYEPIYLGGQLLQGITMPRYTGRTAVKVDMGTATITERWGAYLDYDPYTELAVYVPFVGIKNIKADDVMGKTIRLMYDIDILSGACIAYIRPEGGSPLYEWSGQCAMQIPITGANWDNIFNSAIHTVATLGGALFAPASAPVLGGAVASAASQAIAAKPRIERSGAMNGVTGFLGQLRPYIIRTIPEAYIPNDQNKFIGYPSYVSVNLGSLTGYNEIASIHLENIPATGDELSELESILKGGVIF